MVFIYHLVSILAKLYVTGNLAISSKFPNEEA